MGDLDKLVGAEYDIEPLKEALIEEVGSLTLGDLPKKVLVSSFDLDNRPDDPGEVRTWKAKFFHNYPGLDSDAGQLVVDVGLRTSMAPAYFPTYQGYIDGGDGGEQPQRLRAGASAASSNRRPILRRYHLAFGRHRCKSQIPDWGEQRLGDRAVGAGVGEPGDGRQRRSGRLPVPAIAWRALSAPQPAPAIAEQTDV